MVNSTSQQRAASGAPSEIVKESFALLRERILSAWRGFSNFKPIISSSATPAQPSVCIGEGFGTISDSVRLRTSLVYCPAFVRTAKSASTAVAEHGSSAGY